MRGSVRGGCWKCGIAEGGSSLGRGSEHAWSLKLSNSGERMVFGCVRGEMVRDLDSWKCRGLEFRFW